MTQNKKVLKTKAGELPEITIKKTKIVGETEYLVNYHNTTIWCKSYEISDDSIMFYKNKDHSGYIGNIFIQKEKIKEYLKRFI